MEFTISFDMRAPDFGAPAKDLYAAALDQCAWADELGFDFVGIGEHHATDDGYLPSPIVFASAVAARTRHILLRPSVLLAPFYDPLKLAEDLEAERARHRKHWQQRLERAAYEAERAERQYQAVEPEGAADKAVNLVG